MEGAAPFSHHKLAHVLRQGPFGSEGKRGNSRVRLGSARSGTFAALSLAVVLAGCANSDVFDTSERWFSRPLDWTGRNGGYTFSEMQESGNKAGPVTATELVDANGACPPAPLPAAPAGGPPVDPSAAAGAAQPPSLLGGGIALGMTECDVVYRAGAPSSVQLSSNPNGARVAVLTYDGGPRPGIYRFESGRLMGMDRVQAANPPPPKKKVARRKKRPVAKPQQVSTE